MRFSSHSFTLVALAAALVLSTGPMRAQDQSTTSQTQPGPGMHGEHHRMDAEHQLKFMTKRLNLTDAQQQQILPLLKSRDQQMETMHADTSMSRDDQRQKMMDLNKSTHEQIRNVLTDQQKRQFDAMMQEHEGRMREHGNGSGAMGGNSSSTAQPQ